MIVRPRTVSLCTLSLALVLACDQKRSERAAPATEKTSATETAAKQRPKAAEETTHPLDVTSKYTPSGLVGDSALLKMNPDSATAHSPPNAIEVDYAPEEKGEGFAGVCWQTSHDNWGEKPGDNLSQANFRRIALWAKGKRGGEVVEFRAGGIDKRGHPYRDSFDVSITVKLTTEWQRHAIFLNDEDLTSVLTPFCFILHRTDNRAGAGFYLDDVRYEG